MRVDAEPWPALCGRGGELWTTSHLEMAGLADHWDDVVRRNTAHIVRETARRVVVAIARAGRDLHPEDFRLWRELHEDLRDSNVELLPVQALPAA